MRGVSIRIRCDTDIDRGRKGISDRLEAEVASSDERGGNVYDSGVDAGIMREGGHQQ
jgi:hypothetical protein